jgi:hypothetical protein
LFQHDLTRTRNAVPFAVGVEAGSLFLVPVVPVEAVLTRFRPPRMHK